MTHFTRRGFIAHGGVALGALTLAPQLAACAATAPDTGLDKLAQSKGMRFGASARAMSLGDAAFMKLFFAECGITGATNDLKWKVIFRDSPTGNFADADRFVHFMHDHGLLQRGQVLIWDKAPNMPRWFQPMVAGRAAPQMFEQMLVQRVSTMVQRYRGLINSWDVVNEAIRPGHGDINPGPFMTHLGPGYMDLAFNEARKADPAAQLVYNDYPRPTTPAHQQGILTLLRGFRDRKVPVDAFGIQSHLYAADLDGDYRGWGDFLDSVADMDYDIVLTELDVVDDDLSADIPTRDQQAATLMGKFLETTLANKRVKHIVCRSLTDRYEGLSSLMPRPDSQKRRPSPFDGDLKPKPMYFAMRDALNGAPAR